MPGKNIRILLIEDNDGDARLVEEMLAESRSVIFRIDRVDNLDLGLSRIKEGYPDAILLDLSLPDSQGFETFSRVILKTREIPIILMSGLDDEDIAIRAVHEGGQDYLMKGHVDSRLLERSILYAIERKGAEEQIKSALKEKEVLLKEIHHRVKNNLQIISSLLKLQSQYTDDTKILEMLKDSQNRVKSMALIHEKLYGSKDLANINLKTYIHDLVIGLYHSYSKNSEAIIIREDIGDITLGIETAIPCGLIINELVSNALKHAFPGDRTGEIHIKLQRVMENKIILTVEDNGIGISEDFDYGNTDTLGLHLVNILVEDQIEGEIELDRTNGTKFQIEFRG